MEIEQKIFIDTLKNDDVFDEYLAHDGYDSIKKFGMKNNELSNNARNVGNFILMKEQHRAEEHETILKMYNRSIAYAELGSEELAAAYAGRSAFLMHIKKYEESIIDANRVLQITSSGEFKIKILCHKVHCLKASGSTMYESSLKKAEFILGKVFTDENTKKILKELIEVATKDTVKKNLTVTKLKCSNINMVKHQEGRDVFDSVTFKHSSKHSRYLVANRDFEPGEIVCTEEIYATTLNSKREYKNCYYCLHACLTLIPCDYCNWAMFCSENCKTEACNKYHKNECFLMPVIKNNYEEYLFECQIAIRLIIIALNEAGSIENLRKKLNEIDDETDPAAVINDTNLNNKLMILYRLESKTEQVCFAYKFALIVFILFIKLVENDILKKDINVSQVDDLINDKDLLFLGCLFLRFWKIKSKHTLLVGYHHEYCKFPLIEMNEKHEEYCFSVGYGLGILNSYLNHSCMPNVNKITRNKKSILYAVQPIKKNDKLLVCDIKPFDDYPENRQIKHFEQADVHCNCIACKIGLSIDDSIKHSKLVLSNVWLAKRVEKEFVEKILELEGEFDCEDSNQDYEEDKKLVKKLLQSSRAAFRFSPNGCLANCHLYRRLNEAFERMYTLTKISFNACETSNNEII